MKRIVVATSNRGKLGEFTQLLLPLGASIEGLDLHPSVRLPEETGLTYADNATLKAEAGCAATGLPSLGDDSGIEVAALGGRPGLYSARFTDQRLPGESQDVANRRKMLSELRACNVPEREWTARFCCALALARPGQKTVLFWGEIAGLVLPAERGSGGFGYDPLLLLPEQGLTFAEIEEREKNRISHRGRAVAALLEALQA